MPLKKLLKFLAEATIGVLLLAAILLGVTRSLLPFVDHYRSYFETWASQAIAHPVAIGKVEASWRGLYPLFSFDHITIYDSTRKTELLKIKQFQISVNLFSSLINKHIIPAQFHLSGSYLLVHQLKNNKFNINGINLHFVAEQAKNTNIQHILEQILEHGQVLLNDIDVDWYGNNGMVLPIANLQLKLNNGFLEHQLIGAATLIQNNPTHVRLVLNLHGDILHKSHVNADGYIDIKNLELGPWLKKHLQNGVSLTEGNLRELQVWAHWGNRTLQDIQAVFKLNDGFLRSQLTQNMATLNALSGNIAWQRNNNGWDLAADQLRLNINHQLWPLTQISIQTQQSAAQPGLQIYRADTLALAPLLTLLINSPLLTTEVKGILQAMQPIGEIKNLIIRRELPLQNNEPSGLSASADFNHLGFSPWEKIPAFENLNGHLRLSPAAGDVQLAGKNLVVTMEPIFQQPLVVNDYSGHIQWLQTDAGLKFQASNLAFSNSTLSARVAMDLYLPHTKSEPPFIHLLGGFSVDDIAQLHQYLPAGVLKPKLDAWLKQAFVGGENIAGQILLQGPLSHFPFDDHTGTFEIAAHATNLNFSFYPGWPLGTEMNVDALLQGKHLQMQASTLKVLGVPIYTVQGEITDLMTAPLEVQASVVTDVSNGMRFIFASPLKTPLAGLRQLTMQGPMRLNLSLEVPLHEAPYVHELPKVRGDITLLPGVMMQLPVPRISMEQVQGELQFTERSVQSQGLQANWLGEPVAITVQSLENAPGNSVTTIQMTGNAMVGTLLGAYQLDSLQNIIKGVLSYHAQLQLNKNSGQSQNSLIVDSDLQGVEINLPDPIKKIASSKISTQVQIDFSQPNKLNIFASLGKKLSAALRFDTDQLGKQALKSGNVRFGNQPAVFTQASGLIIDGMLARLDWSEVSPLLAPYFGQSKTAPATHPLEINHINLAITELNAFGIQTQQANIYAYPLAAAWNLQINSPTIVGRITLPKDLTQAILGHFQRFTFVAATTQSSQTVEPAKLPPLNLFFKNFSYAQKHLGQLTLVTFPQDKALVIEKLNLDTPNLNLTARGRWQSRGNRQQTTLSGSIKSTDIGAALKAWELTNSLKGGAGNAAFALSWPAAAYQYQAAILNGHFSLNLRKGRIVNISQGTEAEMGIGRILNLLSLQSLPRRLTFDFSDLFSKGFTFDTMKGDFAISRGDMMTNNTFLDGPIGKVEAQGHIGLAAKDYNMIMTITPYVTSSIPVIATIAGGPFVGAAAWVANKIFGGLINHMTSQAYSVQGLWAHPVIEKITALQRRNQPVFGAMTALP